MIWTGWAILGSLLVIGTSSNAQPVYKCVAKGAVVYSYEPCVGAAVVDTTPTQGLDKWTGQSRKGADVLGSERNKQMADAMKPLLNETPLQREKRHRRAKLPPPDRMECGRLDSAIELAASNPGPKQGAQPSPADQQLFEQRRRYRELRC